MPNKLNIHGRVFGRLKVISESGRDKHGAVMWLCACDCGQRKIIRCKSLIAGETNSCGCGVSIAASKPRTHGMSKTPIYARWRAMINRCHNSNFQDFHNYGGRGIQVCDRWKTFQFFFDDMGRTFRPELELDRINFNGNYEPSNCRWASEQVQQRNKRSNHRLTIGGVTKPIIDWADQTGLKANTILTRVRRRWPEHRLLKIANA